MRRFAPLFSVLALVSTEVRAQYVSGYAVENHAACRASNLPGTISELEKFFASPNFPTDMQKNFFWTNARVRGSEWLPARDSYESGETASGFDGVDSALISYIASHGVTTNARYSALMGGTGSGGCYARTSDMKVGDQQARYLVLSTCQGLKIGTGDDPTQPGDKPNVTWSNANEGLNCILGYSNNMMDADDYGAYLLEGLATTDATLAEVFMRAARRVSYANVPAVMCFGPDEATARRNLETTRDFTDQKYGKGGSAYVYDASRRLDHAFLLPRARESIIPRVVKVTPRRVSADKLARQLLGPGVAESSMGGPIKIYRQGSGTLTVDTHSSFVSWRQKETSLAKAMTVKDVTAARIATDFIAAKGLVADPVASLIPTYIIDRGTSIGDQMTTVAKTIVFHQRLYGLTPLAEAGSVEVTIDADGQVTAMNATLVDTSLLRLNEWLDVSTMDISSHRDVAKRRLARRLPNANVTVLDARVGYDFGDHTAMHERGRVMVEVTLEAEEGGFTRRYAEKVSL